MARPAFGYQNAAGKKIPGSTSVLKLIGFMDTDILCNWAARLARQGKDWRKERTAAGAHGSMLHDLCEFKLPNALTEEDRPPQLALPPEPKIGGQIALKVWGDKVKAVDDQWNRLQLSYNAIREWFVQHEPNVVLHEEPLVSEEYGFAGTPDGVATFPRDIPSYGVIAGDHWLYDYKSGRMIGAKEVCQMASYRQLLAERRNIHVKGAILIHAPTAEPGYMRPVVIPADVLDLGWEVFKFGLRLNDVVPQLAAAVE
jgi:hypothetical protein